MFCSYIFTKYITHEFERRTCYTLLYFSPIPIDLVKVVNVQQEPLPYNDLLEGTAEHGGAKANLLAYLKRFVNPGIETPYEKKHWYILIERWYLVAAIVFLEIVFKVSTRGSFVPSIVVILLFSIAIGQVLYALASIAKSPKVNTVLKAIFLGILGLFFTVEYFVFRQFNDFLSVKTVLAGAGGVAGEFMEDVFALIFSARGVAHILLFFLPLIVYLIQAKYGIDRARGTSWPEKVRVLCLALLAHMLAFIIIGVSGPFGAAYTTQYSFHTAVPNYGLLSGIRKDLTTSENVSFDIVDAENSNAASNTEPEEDFSQYEKAVMDIDFEALAESTWDENYQELDRYVASLTPSSKNKMTGKFSGYNLIFISAEAFSHGAISPTLTPTLWRMYTKGIIFTDYYQFESASTTGGECQNIFGLIPVDGGESFKETAYNNNYFTTGSILNRLGYNGWAFHNNTYTFYDRNETHNNLGYNNGYMAMDNGMEEYVTQQWPQSDYEMIKGTFDNIYCDQEPFNVYYMSVSGHSNYGLYGNAMSEKNWAAVEQWANDNKVDYNETILGYLAANLELEYAMQYLVEQLEARDMARHTLIVLTADHFPYGLDEGSDMGGGNLAELYRTSIDTFFDRDLNALIMWSASLEDEDPIVVRTPTCSLDILPTLCNLFDVEWDSRLLPGRDVFSDAEAIVFNPAYFWKTIEGVSMYTDFTPNPDSTLTNIETYADRIDKMVANKMNYCRGVLSHDYYYHVFGEAWNVDVVHDNAVEVGLKLHEEAVARTQPHTSTEGDENARSKENTPEQDTA